MNKEKVVRRAEDVCNAVNEMNAAMDRTPEQKTDVQLKISAFKKRFPDAKYMEPVTKIPTAGNKHPEFEKQREYLTEYVVGIFESQLVGQTLDFFLTGLPGDDYCRWIIPVNKPIGIPRFVAKHLSEKLAWKEMKPMGRGNEPAAYYDDQMNTPFEQFEYKRRGTFHPINAY